MMAGQQALGAGQRRRWRRGFRALTLASVFTLPAVAQQVPQGGTVAVGAATITGQGSQTLINQTSNRALIDWRSFDIGSGASVQVVQPGAAAILVNRVTGNGVGTRIDGSLSANGQVVVIDKAGVVIGRGARVDAGSFLATTADIDNDDFAAGHLNFAKAGRAGAAIVNEGTINVADGGYAVLAGASVRNSGVVSARLGRVVLAGAERFTLDLAGDGLLRFELPSDVAGRLVNDGMVTGAQVLMTARAARNGMAGVVNVGGLVEATSARQVGGRILIGGDGSDTMVTGQVRATGGQVDILGGTVTLTGAAVDVSSAQGDGGHIRVGGDFQGRGDLERARTTRIDAASTLAADGGAGVGGRVIVWSDGHTDFAGKVSARGTGDGGFAEVSGKGSLRFAGTADLAGGAGAKAGELLLDPTNITIGTVADVDGMGSQDDDIPNSGSIGSGAYGVVTSLITASAIADLLNNGTSVTLSASNDINVDTSIAQTGGWTTSLSLNAGRDLVFANTIGVGSSNGSLSLNFQAGRSVTATGGSFTSRGGAISITGSGGGTTGIGLSGVSINAGSGTITLSGTGTATGVSLDSSTSLVSSFGDVSVTGTGVNGIIAQGSSVVRAGSGDVILTGAGGSGGVGLSISGGATIGGAAQSGTVSLRADDMALAGSVIRSSGTVNLRTRSNSRDLLIGEASDSASGLALSTTELATVTAGTLSLGHTGHTGAVTVSANPSTSNISALELLTSSLSLGSAINGLLETFLNAGKGAAVETSGAISVTDSITKNAGGDATLTLRAGGNLSFDNGIGASSSQGRLNMDFTGGYSSTGSLSTSGAGAITSNGGSVTLAGRSGLTLSGSSLTAGAGTIILSGGDIALSGTSITSTGRVQVRPFATGGQMNVGATGAGSGAAHVSQAELNQISAGILRIGALDGGNMVISDDLSHASNVIELASAGTVTQSADINVTNLALLGSGGNFTLTRSGNAVSTIAANTGSLDFHSGSSLSVGTVAGTTGVTFTGNASLYSHAALMTLGQTATYAGSGTGTLTLSGDIDLAVSANAAVSGSGRMNIVLAADGNAAGSPGYVAISNASLSTNGGDITIGSGSNPTSRAAVGKAATGIGVNITSSTLNSGSGGDILINGEGAGSGTNASTGIGINVSASTIQASGSGTITLNGEGGAGNSLTAGVAIGNGSTIRSASGAIAINGAQAATGTSRYGILLRDDPGNRSAIFSTSSGGVELKATGTAGRIAANGGTGDSSRAYIGWDGSNAYGGTVTLTADAMELTSATGTAAISIGGSGNLVLRSLSTGASVAIGDGAVGASDLELGQTELDTLRAGFSSVTVGRSDATGTVSVAGAAFKDNVTIQGGTGAVTVSGALTTGSLDDAGTLSLQTTGLLSISAGISTQNQNITLTADRLALTGTINAGTGTVTLTNASASRAIDVGSTTNAANALEISAAELNLVTAGVIRVGASNSGAISITQAIAPTGSSNLHLRSGAGITQSAGITVTNLAVTAGGDVVLSSQNNAVTGFAASTSNDAVSLRDDTGFAIASIDGVGGVSIGTGNLSLTSTGAVTQSASIGAAGLQLTGTGGAYTLTHASNAVGTIAANTGTLDIGLSGAVSVGTVGGTTGIATTGTLALSSGGNLTIASGAAVAASGTGDALVLAANGNFTNNAGASALSVTGGGRFLVFSNAPATSSTGGISALPYYNRAYNFTNRTYSALTNSGDRFVYTYAPTLTVTPDTVSRTYTGSTITGLAYSITGLVTGDTLAQAVSGTGTISGAGRNVGAYTLTAGAGTLASDLGYGFSYGTGTLTVTQKALTYAVANGNVTYGTQATNGAITWTGLVNGDDVAGTITTYRGANAETLAVRTPVGTLTQRVTALTGADAGNYQIAGSGNTDGVLTIAQKALTYSVAAANSIYGTLATLGAATLNGVVGGDTVTATVGLSGATLSAGLAAGTYTQTISLGGADLSNYSVAGSGNSIGNLTIARKTLTYAIDNATSIYGTLATPAAPNLTGLVGNDAVIVTSVLSSGTLSDRLAAGTYTLVSSALGGAAAGNYVLASSGNQTGSLTVSPKALTASIAAVTSTYGNVVTTGDVTLGGLLSGDDVAATLVVQGAGGNITLNPKLSVGTYTQRTTGLTGADADNYTLTNAGTATASLTINPAALTIKADSLIKTYGTADPALTYAVTGLVEGDSLTGGLTRAAGANVGTYAISPGSLAADANYTLSFQGGTLTINPAPLTIAASSFTRTYGTDDPTLTYAVTGLVAGDAVTGSLTRAAGKDVGTYAINQGSLDAGANYTITYQGGSLTINPAPLTIAANSFTRIYGTDDPALTYTVTGLVAGDAVTGNLTRAAGRDVGTYAIQQGSLNAGANYTITYQGGTLSITPAALTISALSATKTYGDVDPTPSYAVTGLVAGDSLSGALQRAGGEDAGTYAINQGSLTAGPNYDLTFQGGTLTIGKAALTVTADAISRLYLDKDPALTYQVAGLKRGDSAGTALSGALTRAAGEDVGSYAISQGSLAANGNYTLAFTGTSFRINAANLTLSVVAPNVTKIYGDADPVFAITATGLRGVDTIDRVLTGSMVRAGGEDVGTYAISQGTLASINPNYIISFTPGTLTIAPANLSVAAMMVTRTYGDGDPTLTYTVSGLKRGDSAGSILSGSLGRAAGEDAGSYVINQGSLALTSRNYTMSFTAGQLTINPALLNVTADAQVRLYGASDPALSFQVSGLSRGDQAGSVLSGGLTRAAGGNAGRYAISQGTLAANGNYRISFQGADFTINPVPLSVLVDNVVRQAGAANPLFTARFQGLVNGDTSDSLTGLRFRTLADATSPAGPYAITASGIGNGNYQITYVDGVLTVTGGGVLPPAVAEAAPVTTITQPVRAPVVPSVAAPVAAPTAPTATASSSPTAPATDGGSAALAAVNQNVQSASGSAADDDSAAEEMIPGLLSQQRRLPGEVPEGTPGLEQQFPNLGRVW